MTFWKFLSENWYSIVSIIVAIVGLVIGWLNSSKTRKTKLVNAVYIKIPSLVRQANVIFGKGNGIAKFNYVLTELKAYAMELDTKVDIEDLTTRIEDEVKTLNCERDAKQEVNIITPSTNSEVDNSVEVTSNDIEVNKIDM